jgi:1,4-alpha-glucan branching enzyme
MGNLMAPTIDRILRDVVFKLDGWRVPNAHWVALVGSFNRWDTAAHRMQLGPDNVWTIAVVLAPSEYRYLFIVDGMPWNDPLDDGRAPCEWGGQYSVRIVR